MRLMSCFVVCAALSALQTGRADEWEARRSAAVNRPRGLVYNTDGCDMLYWPSNLPVSVGNFTGRRLKFALGTHVTTVSYCPQSAGFGHFTCRKAGDPLLADVPIPAGGCYNSASKFFAMGTDSLEMACDFCRSNNLEVFVSLRFNDTHDAAYDAKNGRFSPLFPKFKRDNPECLMGSPAKEDRPKFCSWSAVDFSHEKVRAHMRKFVRELVENYDVDGIEYDFNRHMQIFSSVAKGGEASQAELDVMTEFMKELRAITEEVGRRKNHPIVVAMRAPDSVGYCRAVGIDLERWLEMRLVDIWIGAGYFRLNHWDVSSALAHRYGVKFYASLDESRIQRVTKAKGLPIIKGRMTNGSYASRMLDAKAGGCDGVYIFNIEGPRMRGVACLNPEREPGRIHFAVERGSGGFRPWRYLKDGGRFSNMPRIDPGEPRKIKAGEQVRFTMLIGERFGSPEIGHVRALMKTTLKGDPPGLLVNGRRAAFLGRKGDALEYDLDDVGMICGRNVFELEVPASVKRSFTVNDFAVSIVPSPRRLVLHLDFNTIQMRKETVLDCIRSAAKMGYNAVLWEVEDKVRWETCPECVHPEAFSKEEFRNILAEAKRLGLEPIPLLQTFGHAEYVLMNGGHREWMEDPSFPACYCASNPGVRKFLRTMLDEYLELFGEDVKLFHLGGDEAVVFGTCPVCSKRGKMELYIEHLESLAAKLREKGIRPGVWSDMILGDAAFPELAKFPKDYVVWNWDYVYDGKPDGPRRTWTGRLDAVKAHGLDVIFSTSSASAGDSCFTPRYGFHSRNIAASAALARKDSMLGLCMTSWSVRKIPKSLQAPLWDFAARRYLQPSANEAKDLELAFGSHFTTIGFTALDEMSRWDSYFGMFDGIGWMGLIKNAKPAPKGTFEKTVATAKEKEGDILSTIDKNAETVLAAVRGNLAKIDRRAATDFEKTFLEGVELSIAYVEALQKACRGSHELRLPKDRTESFYRLDQAPGSAKNCAEIVWSVLNGVVH